MLRIFGAHIREKLKNKVGWGKMEQEAIFMVLLMDSPWEFWEIVPRKHLACILVDAYCSL